MLTPKQTADALQVSTSTLRRWSSEFTPFLSPRKGVKRLYTTDDLAMLRKVKDLFNEGLNTSQVSDALAIVDTSNTDKALINLADFATALMQARESNLILSEKVDTLTERLDALEKYLKLPFYKRIGKKPPYS